MFAFLSILKFEIVRGFVCSFFSPPSRPLISNLIAYLESLGHSGLTEIVFKQLNGWEKFFFLVKLLFLKCPSDTKMSFRTRMSFWTKMSFRTLSSKGAAEGGQYASIIKLEEQLSLKSLLISLCYKNLYI